MIQSNVLEIPEKFPVCPSFFFSLHKSTHKGLVSASVCRNTRYHYVRLPLPGIARVRRPNKLPRRHVKTINSDF